MSQITGVWWNKLWYKQTLEYNLDIKIVLKSNIWKHKETITTNISLKKRWKRIIQKYTGKLY